MAASATATSRIAMPRPSTGETLQERSKGKDVRTSNIVAAKVSLVIGTTIRYCLDGWLLLVLGNGVILHVV